MNNYKVYITLNNGRGIIGLLEGFDSSGDAFKYFMRSDYSFIQAVHKQSFIFIKTDEIDTVEFVKTR
jgi:hypothetical protein